jgi:signal transduction histidine kinase
MNTIERSTPDRLPDAELSAWAGLFDELELLAVKVDPGSFTVSALTEHTLRYLQKEDFWGHLSSESDRLALKALVREVAQTGVSRGIELSVRTASTGERWYRFNLRKGVATEQAGIWLAMQDVTWLRNTFQQGNESENWLRTVTECVPFALWIADEGGIVRFQSPVCLRKRGVLIGRPWVDGPQGAPPWEEDFQKALKGESLRREYQEEAPAKQAFSRLTVPIRASLSTRIEHVLGVDLEMPGAGAPLPPEVERLVELGGRSAVVAHEIRHPLSALMNAVSLSKGIPGLPESLAPLLDIVEDEALRLERLTANILGFFRPPEAVLKPQELVPLLEKALNLALRLDGEKKVTVHRDFEENLPWVMADEPGMLLAFENLLRNSVQAMKGKGALYLGVRREGDDFIQVSLEDTGPGIPEDIKERVFEPFVTTRRSGVGLGMSIVRHVIQINHRGSILGEAPQHGGTRWVIRLPLKA